jgi:hypothetical protein
VSEVFCRLAESGRLTLDIKEAEQGSEKKGSLNHDS